MGRYHDTLGVPKEADPETIRRAYHRAMRRWDMALNPHLDAAEAHARLVAINEAAEALLYPHRASATSPSAPPPPPDVEVEAQPAFTELGLLRVGEHRTFEVEVRARDAMPAFVDITPETGDGWMLGEPLEGAGRVIVVVRVEVTAVSGTVRRHHGGFAVVADDAVIPVRFAWEVPTVAEEAAAERDRLRAAAEEARRVAAVETARIAEEERLAAEAERVRLARQRPYDEAVARLTAAQLNLHRAGVPLASVVLADRLSAWTLRGSIAVMAAVTLAAILFSSRGVTSDPSAGAGAIFNNTIVVIVVLIFFVPLSAAVVWAVTGIAGRIESAMVSRWTSRAVTPQQLMEEYLATMDRVRSATDR